MGVSQIKGVYIQKILILQCMVYLSDCSGNFHDWTISPHFALFRGITMIGFEQSLDRLNPTPFHTRYIEHRLNGSNVHIPY